ncbi:hypothetical protein CGZ94_04960 [Enemella evansiae]|uniref:Uncharacterized protein n=1 Tax=Enemella evansiae TaxID=2016499 RepID=A0A255GPH3_9ACTN|nr:hypothetical protein [Enemella evansiae]OYO16293.1 hypothetical protein CGZ94_04960 [Enemella evansiae]
MTPDKWGPRTPLMLALGALWIAVGAGVIAGLAPEPDSAPHTLLPELLRGTIWITTGLVALVAAPSQSRRALILLIVMPAVRVGSYVWAWLVWLLPAGGTGDPAGLYRSLFALAMIGFVAATALVPTAPPILVRRRRP